jgi:hypothetical protein
MAGAVLSNLTIKGCGCPISEKAVICDFDFKRICCLRRRGLVVVDLQGHGQWSDRLQRMKEDLLK